MKLSELQQQLNASRASRTQLSDQWQRARETLRTLAAQKGRLTRQGWQQSPEFAALLRREAELSKALPQYEQALRAEQDRCDDLLGQLHALPPQQAVNLLSG